jgi:DNA polymerase III alpha subunit
MTGLSPEQITSLERHLEISDGGATSFLLEEESLRDSLPDGKDYYEHIIKNVELDRSNSKNSYIMYLAGKVDKIDLTKPCAFTSRATTLPDIDVDFPTDYREKAIDYVRDKYGADKVCQITTFGRLSGRSAIKGVMRAIGGYDFETMGLVTEAIPDQAAVSDKMEESGDESIITWVLENPAAADKIKPNRAVSTSEFCRLEDGVLVGDYADIFRMAIALEGTFQNQGKHAAGVIISSERVADVSPMCLSKDGVAIAAFDMAWLEKAGLVKFDFLGVDILNKIQEAYGPDIVNVPFTDEETWDVICSGNTKGCFQIENHLGRDWAKEIRPRNEEELSAVISVIRPGSSPKVYADRKNGIEPVEDNAINRVIDTYGVLVYQETLLNIAKKLAGFNSADSIKLMKSVGKKDAKLLFSLEAKFVAGCEKKGVISKEDAVKLFTDIKASARYLFNKSHGISYSYPCYWSAYIKAHKKLDFYKTWLKYSSHKLDPHEEVRNLVLSAKLDNVEILPPSCEYLTEGFFIKDDAVVFGLSHIKGVANRELEKLFSLMRTHGVRASLVTYLTEILPNVNKRTCEALINCGCFHYLGVSRAALLHYYECFSDLSDKELTFFSDKSFESPAAALEAACGLKKEGGACATKGRVEKLKIILERLTNPGRILHDLPGKIAASEEAAIGITLSCSYMDACLAAGIADTTCKEIMRGKPGKRTIFVRITEVKEHIIKSSDKKMAFLTVSDDTAEIDNLVCFADQYEQFGRFMFDGAMVAIYGELGKKKSFVIDRCTEL